MWSLVIALFAITAGGLVPVDMGVSQSTWNEKHQCEAFVEEVGSRTSFYKEGDTYYVQNEDGSLITAVCVPTEDLK